MENNNINKTSAQQQHQEDSGLNIRDLWGIVVNHWQWFLISAVVCLLAATFYCTRAVPVYTRSASVLIKEDRKSGSIAGDLSGAFSDLGMSVSHVNVNNEIINFKSPDLMLQVAKNLKLDVDYKIKGRRHEYTIYGTSLPLEVDFLDNRSRGTTMLIEMIDTTTVEIKGFTRGGDKIDAPAITACYGDTLDTPIGCMVVNRSEYATDRPLEHLVKVSRGSVAGAAASCRARLTAALSDKNSTVIVLGYKDVNTQRAEDVLRMVINVYNENWIKDKNQITSSTNEFIADRLDIIEKELGNVDKTITNFRSTHRLPDAGNVVQMDMQMSAEAGKHLLELNNQLSIARFLQSDIRSASAGTLLPANVGLNDASTQGQIQQFNTTVLQRNRLVESSSEENLLVVDLDQQLALLKSAILTSLDNYIRSVNIQIQSAQSARQTSEARVSDIPQQAGQLLSDERQQKVKEALYLYLLQKREENELSQAFTAYNTRVVASPNGSSKPVSPNKRMIYLIALLLGLAFPFVYFYLRETMNTTVRGRKDLENLSVPFLGELPGTVRKKGFLFRRAKISDKKEDRKIVVKPHSRNIINEAFRVVRTNLEFMKGKEPGCRVIMTTSFNVGAGKTFISSNLSSVLAIKKKRVAIVDLDLRKRSLSALADQPKNGVVDYLSGATDDWQQYIVHDFGGNPLDLLPAGAMPPNPAELLGEARLSQLVNDMKNYYDYVFLDCPPIEIVTDADLIAPVADITLFVVRAGLFDRGMLPQVERYYNEKRYNNMALLLNGTEAAGRYGYKYGYKYGYRYGYSYGKYGYGYGKSAYGYGYGNGYGYGSDDEDGSGKRHHHRSKDKENTETTEKTA